jgi:tetratricopeptide (TPR) repeat protein
MSRENLVFTACGLLLGLIIGSFLIGPHLAKSAPEAPPAQAAPAGNPMEAVRNQIATLKDQVARDPRNFDALVQLGNLYMDAAKFPQAIDYYQRALAVREDPVVRTDMGICLKQSGQLDQALASFQQASREAPQEWQADYNAAIVLGDLRRFDEARAISAKLKASHPNEPEVQKLDDALKNAPAR